MTARLLLSLTAAVALGGNCGAEELRTGSFADALARLFSAEVRRADARLQDLDGEIAALPSLERAYQGTRYGFHSGTLFAQNDPQWIRVDLLDRYLLDAIVLVPADVVTPAAPGEGYGFPLRFKIEVAGEADFSDATVIVDETSEDFPNPGRFPLVYGQPGREARYVRFTSTKHWPTRDGAYAWALGEIMVLSGHYNVAVHKPQEASSSLSLAPHWTIDAINDGQSIVGLPVSTTPSPTNGYRSSEAESGRTLRWVTVDLGKETTVDEVRLIPAWPSAFADEAGMGYPRAMKALLSNDPQFRDGVVQLESLEAAGNPQNNAHTIPVAGQKGRYLRVEANRLWERGDLTLFALAEVQVFSSGENVALGKQVTANDVAEGAESSRWAPEFLVDGFSSQHELVPWPTYLRALEARGELERERAGLDAARAAQARSVADTTILLGSVVAGVALVALFVVVARHRAVRQRDQALLREQIARDLHDELGSNLGSISLLSELGSRREDLPEAVRHDLAEIHRTTERSAEAMRDIVWLVDSGSSTLRELVAKMREAAERLAGEKLVLSVTPSEIEDCKLPLQFRRHALYSFKETLNNVRRHADARKVEVAIACGDGKLEFTVQDDGVGFRVDERLGLGHGLKNLMRRAQRLKGRCRIDSRPEGGTTVRFEAPLRSRNHGERYERNNPGLAG